MKTVTIRRSRPKQLSDKQKAKRLAAGEKWIRSSVRPPQGAGASVPKVKSKPAKPRKAIAKVGKQKAKRQAKNAAYYKSPEWRAKKQAVHERDGFQCVETVEVPTAWFLDGDEMVLVVRCPNRGEVVNHKQTARGLVCEEVSYGHRGVEGYIDTCKTRCRDCDRRRTPLERANHVHGFNNGISSPRGIGSNG